MLGHQLLAAILGATGNKKPNDLFFGQAQKGPNMPLPGGDIESMPLPPMPGPDDKDPPIPAGTRKEGGKGAVMLDLLKSYMGRQKPDIHPQVFPEINAAAPLQVGYNAAQQVPQFQVPPMQMLMMDKQRRGYY